jgi:tetratricopeptide (TPR) repeat protein
MRPHGRHRTRHGSAVPGPAAECRCRDDERAVCRWQSPVPRRPVLGCVAAISAGVAHYKAQQHVRARESLLEASQYGPLQPISHYNLGLNAYAQGDIDEALRWFRRARDQEQRKDISRLAQRAITQLNRELAIADPIKVPATVRERERKSVTSIYLIRHSRWLHRMFSKAPSFPSACSPSTRSTAWRMRVSSACTDSAVAIFRTAN